MKGIRGKAKGFKCGFWGWWSAGLYYDGGEVVISEGLDRKVDLEFQVLHLDSVDVDSENLAGSRADLRERWVNQGLGVNFTSSRADLRGLRV